MGKTFGVISLILALIALILGWLIIWFVPYGGIITYAICGVAVVLGIVGIVVDDSKGPGIAGLILGIIAFIVNFLMAFFLLAFILAMLGMSMT